MKKNNIVWAIIMLLTFSLTAQTYQKTLTSADYEKAVKLLAFNTNKLVFNSNVVPGWLPDGNFWYSYTTDKGKEFALVNSKDGTKKTATTLEQLIAQSEIDKSNIKVAGPNEVASPDGKKVAYIKDWNLWIRDVSSKNETQLTFDGVKDFGYATDNAGWIHSDRPILLWSPNSKKIATFQQDQRHVNDMHLVTTNVGAPILQSWKYPLPDDKEIIQIQRVIIDVENAKVIRLKIPADPRRGTLCDDISCSGSFDDNEWNAEATKLAFVSSSRDHKEAKLRIADANTGEVTEMLEEKVATQYESGQGLVNWHFLDQSNEIIWYSERDDWGHLYLYNVNNGKLKTQITKGNFVVTKLLKIDEKNRLLYFEANGREAGRDPYFSHFYKINFNGKNLQLLTPEIGNHNIFLSPDGSCFVDNYSQPNVPPISVLRNSDGKLITTLEKADVSKLVASGWKAPEPITVKSRDNKWDLNGLMFTPTDLDVTKKYPVVNYIYPGPQGGGVGSRNFASARGDHQALAALGFIVVIIDGTCNPDRSKSFHDACYGNMADNTLEDQISGLQQLAIKYPYMDLDKVGIWGHSGGGYATAAAMFRYPDFYKVGISESGNHENRNYEDDWGERYIGLLTKDSNGKSNYEDQANQNFAANLKGKLLLVHGGMDDNVPPYNTYLVVQALEKANKDFDLIIFPNARHGYAADSYYMMRRRWDYFVTNLMQAAPPKEFLIKSK